MKTAHFLGLVVAAGLIVAACSPNSPTVVETPPTVQAPVEQPTAAPTASATPESRSLVICLGQEPETLYAYGGSSRAMWGVLEAVYDGPIDQVGYQPQPVILEAVPSIENGSAQIQAVDVRPGDVVVDASGSVVSLTAGAVVAPSGCSSGDCALTYDGVSPLQLDQVILTYRLLPGVQWSDGSPLTAADSVYSYNLSASPDTPVSKRSIDRTAQYEAIDEQTVQWTGRPGFIPARFESYFWQPLPEHLWGELTATELLTAEQSTRMPVGWGPYQIDEWVAGDHITLSKNPAYFRAAEGLPKFDSLVYRFLGEPADNNIAALLTSECDVVDQTSLLDEQLELILELEQAGDLKAYIGQGPEWEHVDFGIRPSSYDDGYNPASGDRPDLFADVRTRQAFAYCMDRQGIVDELLFGRSSVPSAFLPPDHPNYDAGLAALPYDPDAGAQLLSEVGWQDQDGDPNTPRTAVGVTNVPDGTPLFVRYATTQAPLRGEVAKRLAASLAGCGIQVDVLVLEPGQLYGRGPEGPLFGRNFDLAQFAWESGLQPSCSLYETAQTPDAGNNWLSVNVTGYSNPAFDAACAALKQAHPGDQAAYAERAGAVQSLFAEELPSVPLYFRLKMAISRPDLCGLEFDVSARTALWNLENFALGSSCP